MSFFNIIFSAYDYCDPYEAIFNHFPQNTGMEYIIPNIDMKTFEAIPRLDGGYFELGYDGRKTLKKILT